jgi:L,D-transpeptidase catalytic domain
MTIRHSIESRFSRRQLLGGALMAAGALALPSTAFAAVDNNRLREIARRELDRGGARIWLRDTVGIIDYSLLSREPRFYFVDMLAGQVKSLYVTHGRGSDPEHDGWLKSFSNEPSSAATSRGAYVTRNWYEGKHGTSMRLIGLDADNSNAEDRAIVVHGAAYANPSQIEKFGKLGRSEGCFAFPEANLLEVAAKLGPGRLLFADQLEGPVPQPVIEAVTSAGGDAGAGTAGATVSTRGLSNDDATATSRP